MKKVIIPFIILAIGVGGFLMSGSMIADRMNPFISSDNYYTVVKTDGKYLGKDKIHTEDDCYEYEFTGYSNEGKEQKIIINAPKSLRHDAYLLINSKGKNGKYYEEVQLDKIPEAAKAKLGLK
ncbi:YxeA family protein [Clostridium beijerinckii]|uniref:YxeA family protein n=1 Tax=Clostridium beijerinckii TaxID=1520 RepID=A0A7X9SQH8_CLOBE|nr:YxeA family protein [Clostridium beijerinckii]NMF06027.1 YxeA family protein [Clostridium beijerinckii]